MKLLMISGDRSILRSERGAFWYTLQEMQKHWDRIDILCPKIQHSFSHSESRIPCPSGRRANPEFSPNVFFHPNPHGLWSQPLWIQKCGTRLIRSHHHDVMTVHEYPPFYNGRGALQLHRRTGIPFALEIHHVVGRPTAANVQERIGAFLSQWVIPREARKAVKVRTVSSAVFRELCRLGVHPDQIHILPSFYLDHALIRSIETSSKSYDIAFCARLVPNKGLESVIEALRYLSDARLLVIGDGPLRSRMERLVASYGMENRVTFLGWLPTHEAVLGAILTARTFVMASTSEGGPRSALEAMACGVPVVVTPVGVMPEVIDDGVNGMFTDGSPKDIAMKIGALLNDEERRQAMGEEATRILDRFERKKLVECYATFLKGLVTS